jgi:hypothetical protein
MLAACALLMVRIAGILQLIDLFTAPVEPGQHTDTRPLDGFSGWPQRSPAQVVLLDVELKMSSHLEIAPNQSAPKPRFDDRGPLLEPAQEGFHF